MGLLVLLAMFMVIVYLSFAPAVRTRKHALLGGMVLFAAISTVYLAAVREAMIFGTSIMSTTDLVLRVLVLGFLGVGAYSGHKLRKSPLGWEHPPVVEIHKAFTAIASVLICCSIAIEVYLWFGYR